MIITSGSAKFQKSAQEKKSLIFQYYCKSRNFRENYNFAYNVKRQVWDVKNPRMVHDLPTSVNGRVISIFPEGFISTKLRICKNKTFRENF